MLKLTFINLHDLSQLEIRVEPGTMLINAVRTLVSDGRLKLPWRCGQGTCGACQVRLEHAGSGQMVTLSRKEKNVLARHAGLAAESPLTLPDTPELIRLACHIRIDSDLTIYVE